MMKVTNKIRIKTILIGIFIIYVAFTFVKQQITLNMLDEKYNEIKSKEIAVQIENKELNNQIKYIETDKFIENEARQKLGLIKKGEIMYIDTSKENKDSTK
ncbi:septum formation initiator family protein [Thermoanaerobacterium sp. RBIITD]|uniref:FtsB family cell division protein n=1 Tax=Thermoanaerobacterium sp. RBIITD TaxID=1550240 RepID=UPI000BC0090E|nr:septum formation initiator family protein [Thermoanaerobacterium sp. RBIITD]SNX54036.1 Septum formation initiator [Thermoanaerobacterium sp. RBIITD]